MTTVLVVVVVVVVAAAASSSTRACSLIAGTMFLIAQGNYEIQACNTRTLYNFASRDSACHSIVYRIFPLV